MPPNPQDLYVEDVFTRHPPQYTDSFILLLKAIMVFGKVTDYNTRSNLRATAPPSKNQNPFALPGFEALDRLVTQDFLQSFPTEFKHLGVSDDVALDTDLYMAHVAPHAYVMSFVAWQHIRILTSPILGPLSRCTTHTSTSQIP